MLVLLNDTTGVCMIGTYTIQTCLYLLHNDIAMHDTYQLNTTQFQSDIREATPTVVHRLF